MVGVTYDVHFNSQISSELRKGISTSSVNQQLTWGWGANLDSNTTLFYHALITG